MSGDPKTSEAGGPANPGGKSFAWSTIAEATALPFLLAAVFMARGLGPEGYGQIAFAMSFCIIVGLIMDGDLSNFLNREFGAHGEKATEPFRVALGLLLCAGGLFVVLTGLVFWALSPDATTTIVISGATAATYFFLVRKALRGVLRGNGRFDIDAISMAVERVGLMLLGAATLTGALTAETTMIIFAVIRGVTLLGVAAVIHTRIVALRPKFDVAAMASLAWQIAPFAITMTTWTVYNHTDGLMLGAMRGAADVGAYMALYRLFEGLFVFPTVIVAVLLPWMSREHVEGRPIEAAFANATRWLLIASVATAMVVVLAPAEILGIVYGAAYLDDALSLAILLGAAPFVFLFWFYRAVFMAIRRTRMVAILSLVSVFFNIALNFYAIPRWGVAGACGATLLTEALNFAIAAWLLSRQGYRIMGLAEIRWAAITAVAFAAGMVVCEAAFGWALLGIAPGALIAHLALCRTGFWNEDERGKLKRLKLAW